LHRPVELASVFGHLSDNPTNQVSGITSE